VAFLKGLGMPRSVTTLTFDEAIELVQAAVQAARARGNQIAVAVLDAAGDCVAAVRMDGVSPVALEAAAGKARSAVAFRTTSGTMMAVAERALGMGLSMAALGGLVLMAGAVPVVVDGVCIGAIGVAGGGADEADALAGITAVFGQGVADAGARAAGPHGARAAAGSH
jgi:glc operon protein GlcG